MATSLYLETGKRVQRAALAAALIEELDKLYAALQSGDTASYLTAYRRDCLTLGREVQLLWQDVKEKVTALDVDEQFGLVVRRADGTVETIRTGGGLRARSIRLCGIKKETLWQRDSGNCFIPSPRSA